MAEQQFAHTGVILSYMQMSDVERWAGTTVGRRGDDYEAFKRQKAEVLLDSLEKHFPGLLADPNLQNGAMLKFGTFVQFPQAAEKGITEETLSVFFTEANAL